MIADGVFTSAHATPTTAGENTPAPEQAISEEVDVTAQLLRIGLESDNIGAEVEQKADQMDSKSGHLDIKIPVWMGGQRRARAHSSTTGPPKKVNDRRKQHVQEEKRNGLCCLIC